MAATTTRTVHTTSTNGTVVWVGIFGAFLGFSLGMIGFGDFAELNAMFTFQDWRMFLSFAGGVSMAAVLFTTFARHDRGPNLPFHKGIVPGAVLFGAGWALTGGCPAIPIVQVATGYVPGLVTLAGVVVGMRLFRKTNSRWFHLDPGSCGLG